MSEQIVDSVKSKYGAVAESTLSNNHAGVQAVAEAFGYSQRSLGLFPRMPTWVCPVATQLLRRIFVPVR